MAGGDKKDRTNLPEGAVGKAESGIVVEGALYHKQVTITNAQMLALNTTPVELVAAPGSGKMIVLQDVSAKHNYATAAFSDTDLTIGYDDGADLTVTTIDATNFLNNVSASTTRPTNRTAPGAAVLDASAQIENENLALTAGANPTTGGGTLTLDIWYRIVDFN
jgi:hypothetical protein